MKHYLRFIYNGQIYTYVASDIEFEYFQQVTIKNHDLFINILKYIPIEEEK